MDRVIFACVHNAGRSQMAAALFNAMADHQLATAASAGTQPAEQIHPVVVVAMKRVGIDLEGERPQLLTPELAAGATLLVTMGCGDACPYVPGLEVEDWPLPDPKDRPLPAVEAIRDELRARVAALVRSRGWGRDAITIAERR